MAENSMNNGVNNQQRPVRPNSSNTGNQQRPVRPNSSNTGNQQRPVRPNSSNTGNQQRPVRPNSNSTGNQQQPQTRTNSNNNGSHTAGQQAQQQVYQGQAQSTPGNAWYGNNTDQQSIDYGQEAQYNNQGFEQQEFGDDALINDTVAENKERGKKKKKEKKQKAPMDPAKAKKIKLIAIIIAIVIVVVLVLVVVLGKVSKSSSQHITVAEEGQSTPVAEQTTDETESSDNTADSSDEASTGETIEQQSTETEQEEVISGPTLSELMSQSVDSTEQNRASLGEYGTLDVVVNTKTATDTVYTDHDSKIFFRLNKVVSGLSEVQEYVNEYNENNGDAADRKMPSSDSFYSEGIELAMLEFEVIYPSDYPTNGTDESIGRVYKAPEAEMEIFGTIEDIDINDLEDVNEEEFDTKNYIVVGETIFNVSTITDITIPLDVEDGFKVGEPIYFRYVTALPIGASADNYAAHFKLTAEGVSSDLWVNGGEVTESKSYKAAMEKIASSPVVEDATEETEETEENGEEENTEEQ